MRHLIGGLNGGLVFGTKQDGGRIQSGHQAGFDPFEILAKSVV